MKKSPQKMDRFIAEVLAVDSEKKSSIGQLAFIAVTLMTHALPKSKSNNIFFEYRSGQYSLSMIANPHYGLPFGQETASLLLLIIHEIKKTKSPVIRINKTYSKFCQNIFKNAKKHIDQERVYDQMLRLFSTKIVFQENKNLKKISFWRSPLLTNKNNISGSSTIVISNDFFDGLLNLQFDKTQQNKKSEGHKSKAEYYFGLFHCNNKGSLD